MKSYELFKEALTDVQNTTHKMKLKYQEFRNEQTQEMIDRFGIKQETAKSSEELLKQGYVLTSVFLEDREVVVLSKVLDLFELDDETIFEKIAQSEE